MKKILLIFLLLLSGCSFKSLVVPNLPYLVADRIDDRLHLYNDQEYEVRNELKDLFKEEVPRLRKIQEYLQKLEPRSFANEQGYLFFAENYKALAIKVNRILAKQLARIDKKQISRYEKSIIEDNEKIEASIKERSPGDYYKRYEFFFGDLSEVQKKLISQNMDHFRGLLQIRLSERLKVQEQLKGVLKLNNSLEKEKLILALLNDNADRSELTPERLKSIQLLDQFLKTTTNKQLIYFTKKKEDFGSWIKLFIQTYGPQP